MTRPREQVLAYFQRCENRDEICSCLECVTARQRKPVVVFEPEDIQWNRKIDEGRRGWHLALLAMACWVWFAATWQTVEWVAALWRVMT